MSRISSTGITTTSGLISGIPIEETVNQLIAISAAPRNTLASRNSALAAERAAVDTLSSRTLGVRFSLSRLRSATTFSARSVTSSNREAVSATVSAGRTPAAGSYRFTPLRQASTHQLVSSRFDSLSELGGGSLSFGFVGSVDRGVRLDQLNSGAGFVAGEIKITDGDGSTAVIDLRAAQTVDDVLAAINAASEIDVTATVRGDRFVLTDNTGGDGALRVREVNGGATAASLGLAGTGAAGTLSGTDVLSIGRATGLDALRDGLGVRIAPGETGDVRVTLADGTTAEIDLSGAEDVGDILDAFNGAGLGGKLTTSIGPDGDALRLIDSSGGAGSLVVEDLAGGRAAEDLGIATPGATGSLDGRRLVSGLKDSLVSSLNGGAGLALGEIVVTDRAGASATIDLAGAETLAEVVQRINDSSPAVTARINSDRSGLTIEDASGGTNALVIQSAAGGATAEDLGIAINSASASVDGGSLRRQAVSEATPLSEFNGGRGVRVANLRITDSAGATATIDLARSNDPATTLGDVIDRINAASVGVEARLNDAGDGLLLTDTAGGTGVFKVAETGSDSAAADLGIVGDSTAIDESGRQVIDGSIRTTIDLSDLSDSPEATRLDSLGGGPSLGQGVFQVTAASGATFFVDTGVAEADVRSVGDVIDRINDAAAEAGVAVTARVNDAQTGILLEDGTGGGGTLSVEDLGSGTAAADLLLVRTSADTSDDRIDGAGLFVFDGDVALRSLADRINQANAGVTASVFEDGDGFRLSLVSTRAGGAAELVVEGRDASISFSETSRPADAVALFGGAAAGGGFVLTSPSDRFDDAIDGLDLDVRAATGEAVTIDVASNPQTVVDAVREFVAAYNSLRENIATVTDFNAEDQTTGILFGRGEVVRVDTELSRVLTGRYSVGGAITTLQQVGLSVDADGNLALDEAELRAALEESPAEVEGLFRDDENGFLARIDAVIDGLASGEDSLLASRSEALSDTIAANESRIADLDASLTRQRESLLLQFIRLEETIALLQSNVDTISSIQPITISSRSS